MLKNSHIGTVKRLALVGLLTAVVVPAQAQARPDEPRPPENTSEAPDARPHEGNRDGIPPVWRNQRPARLGPWKGTAMLWIHGFAKGDDGRYVTAELRCPGISREDYCAGTVVVGRRGGAPIAAAPFAMPGGPRHTDRDSGHIDNRDFVNIHLDRDDVAHIRKNAVDGRFPVYLELRNSLGPAHWERWEGSAYLDGWDA